MPSFLFFDEGTVATFRAAAGCIVPSEPDSPGADSDEAIAVADRALAARPEKDQRLLKAFLRAVEILPVFRYGRRFTSLGSDQQLRFLTFLENTRLFSKFRQGFFGLKTFALLGYYGLDRTWGELSYPGPRLDAPYYQLRRKPDQAP
jgi:Gluconate 2-dehydrogenase subunit 3